MINNERGNTLITILLVTLIFTTLGLAIVGASISGAKRTETRESDISITNESMNTVQQMTSDITGGIGRLDVKSYLIERNNIRKVDSDYDTDLVRVLLDVIDETRKSKNDTISCLTILDVSNKNAKSIESSNSCLGTDLNKYDSKFNINRELDFTRAFDIILVTTNPNDLEGDIKRTVKKRLIISPIPSFLKYAVGSSDSSNDEAGLFLNGSANIVGNVFANQLAIQKNAKYQLKTKTWLEESTDMTSFMGDLYSSTSKLLPLVKDEKNFYKKEIPELKHDSQFVDIDFIDSFNKTLNEFLIDSEITGTTNGRLFTMGDTLKEDLQTKMATIIATETVIDSSGRVEKVESQENPTSLLGDDAAALKDSFLISSESEAIQYTGDVKIKGDLVILSENNSITFNDRLIVDGDLYIVSYDDIKFLDHVYVTGETHLINFDGKLELDESLISADSIHMESHVNNSDSKLNSKGIKLEGHVVTGNQLEIRPLNSSIQIHNNMISNRKLTINGDESGETHAENDQVIFNSVIYVGGNTSISNVNILGTEEIIDEEKTEGQLILLSKGDLLMTRMNEFSNFDKEKERDKPYLPEEKDEIKPLQAFLYTEGEAELYGVGSLFYINGGIFAKNRLEINAIRGQVNNIESVNDAGEDYLSRFIVNYNQEVLLKRIDALPIVEQLQVVSDEFLVN
jgi:hypothetical protein